METVVCDPLPARRPPHEPVTVWAHY
jgi:hypothetical protein